jgi:hypothetical protein
MVGEADGSGIEFDRARGEGVSSGVAGSESSMVALLCLRNRKTANRSCAVPVDPLWRECEQFEDGENDVDRRPVTASSV